MSAFQPARSLPFDTAFHSPAVKSRLAARPHGRVNVPGLYLQDRAGFSTGSFGFPLPASSGFLSPDGTAHCESPVANSDSSAFRLPSGCRSTPGLLNPSGS
jgi:hypothetical protein